MKTFSPLEHFELNYYSSNHFGSFDISLTTATIYFFFMVLFLLFFYFILNKYAITPTKTQYFLENSYKTILILFLQQINSLRMLKFFPFYFTVLILIFLLNFTSLISYNVSLTGHIMITISYAFLIFIGIIIIGFLNYRLHFLTLFVPQNVPQVLLYFLVIIEVLSFMIRPFSLSIRLFANMLAGHTLLGIFSAFAGYVIKNFSIFFILPIIFCFLILLLEFGVSIIQAYVFFILICIYLNDVCEIKH